MYMVKKYFVHVGAGLRRADVIDGHVYSVDNPYEVVGRMVEYDDKSGIVKVELMQPIYYKSLMKVGVPLENIIFNNTA
jgi:hypothetical protein